MGQSTFHAIAGNWHRQLIRGSKIKDNPKLYGAEAGTRDRVVAAIYESVIRPGLYDAFMEAWSDHIQAALGADMDLASEEPPGGDLDLDPELRAHFARAYEILEQIGRKVPPAAAADQVRNASGFALLADASGDVLAASATARSLLPGARPLQALKADLSAPSAELLDQMLQAAQTGADDQPPVVLTTGSQPRHLIARLVPVEPLDAPARLTLAIESLEYQWSEAAGAMLVTSFGLSRAEVDIVRKLLAGLSLRQIAEQSGRSEHTVRNQAKSVLAKTGAPGQVDLIRLVVFLINQHSAGRARSAGGIDLPFEMMQMRSTGKTMQVCRLGPPGGRPVIFFHGMLEGPAAIQFHRAQFLSRGIQVIVPVRPGFGQSEPAGRSENAIDVMEAHVRELIAGLGPARPVLMSQLAGCLYAHTLACRLGTLAAGAVCVSGGAPVTRISQLSQMPPRQRVVAYTARFAPALLPTVVRAGIAQIDGQEVNDFMTALFKPGTQEHAVIERLGLASLLHAGFRFSVEQGHIGFATDSHFVVRDWGRSLGPLSTRVIYINGAHDPVVSAEHLTETMARRENVEVRVLPEAGQLLIYERPDVVFEALEKVFDAAGAGA